MTLMPRKMIMITALDIWMLTGDIKQPGTGNQSLYNTLLGYASAGWEVHMLTPSRVCATMGGINDGVIIHRMPIRWHDLLVQVKRKFRKLLERGGRKTMPRAGTGKPRALAPPVGLYPYSKVFRRLMGRRAVTLAHRIGGAHVVYGYEIHGALAAAVAAKTLDLPLVTRFQGTELCRFLNQPEEMLKWKTHVEAARVDADLVIMADDGTQGNKVLDALGVQQEQVRFWMNGVVKEDVYRPTVDRARVWCRHGLAEARLVVLHTGRMFHWKRIDRHLRVLRLVRNVLDCFHAVFIGDGPEFADMQKLCSDLQMDDCVCFLGAMPHGEVMNYLNACDVYISFYDLSNLSNSLIEACICGKCIVTTNIGDTSHLLTDNINGVVVSPADDEAAIAANLIRVLQDPTERNRLASKAQERGWDLETWKERMQKEVAEVERVLARRVVEHN